MTPDELWQSEIQDRIKTEKTYQLWKLDFQCQLDCDCNMCTQDKRNWK